MSKPRPLAGMRVLVGRARHQASALSADLREFGAEVIEIPFIEIRKPSSYHAFDSALKHIDEYDWLILTSVNGVDALAGRMRHLRISAQGLQHLNLAAIGPATRNAIERLGLTVAVVPRQYVAESVVESLRAKVEGKRVLMARARVARDLIPCELQKIGARVDVVEAYETVVPKLSRTRLQALLQNEKRKPHVVTFTSSSTVRNFVELLRGQEYARHTALDGISMASIGPVTSSTLREVGLSVDIEALEYTIPGLVRAIVLAAQPSRRSGPLHRL